MATVYERLQSATKVERDRFMAIPLVGMLVAETVEAAPASAGDAAEISRIYTRFPRRPLLPRAPPPRCMRWRRRG